MHTTTGSMLVGDPELGKTKIQMGFESEMI